MAVYSNTRLEIYEQCPLKYKFKYVEGVASQIENVEAFVGKRVHEILEKLHRELLAGRILSLDELILSYRSKWKDNWHNHVKIVKQGYSAGDYFDYGARCIRNYYATNHPFQQSRTLHLEHRIEFDLDSQGKTQIQGYADRIALRNDGTYEIHDYKTGRRVPSQREVDRDRQLSLYQIGFAAQQPDAKRIELILHYLNSPSTLSSRRTPVQLYRVRTHASSLVGEIEGRSEFPAVKSSLCDWCEYRPQCPAWRTGTWVPHASRANRKFPQHRSDQDNRRARRSRKGFLYYLGRFFRRLLS